MSITNQPYITLQKLFHEIRHKNFAQVQKSTWAQCKNFFTKSGARKNPKPEQRMMRRGLGVRCWATSHYYPEVIGFRSYLVEMFDFVPILTPQEVFQRLRR